MLNALIKTMKKPSLHLPIGLAIVLLNPITVMAEPTGTSCEFARTQIEDTRNILHPLEQQQQQVQQYVRTIYQELLACKSGTALSLKQQHCTLLQEEGPKQFQAMINIITLTHQTSQQLARQTRQFQLACFAIAAEDTFSKTTSLPTLQEFPRNNYRGWSTTE